MSPPGPVAVFSRTTFASATAPKSQPARVYGTHGAGVVLGSPVPGSTVTMLDRPSAGGGPVSSPRAGPDFKDDEEGGGPSVFKERYEIATARPRPSGGERVGVGQIPLA